MKEKRIESKLRDGMKRIGGLCIKLTGYVGIPDRLCMYNGRVVFVELKAPEKRPRANQLAYMRKLKDMGFDAIVIDNVEDVDKFIKGFSEVEDETARVSDKSDE